MLTYLLLDGKRGYLSTREACPIGSTVTVQLAGDGVLTVNHASVIVRNGVASFPALLFHTGENVLVFRTASEVYRLEGVWFEEGTLYPAGFDAEGEILRLHDAVIRLSDTIRTLTDRIQDMEARIGGRPLFD